MQHLTPTQTHEFLQQHPDALFIDCRTEMEYMFVGHPVGAQHIPWQEVPDWEINTAFAEQVRALAGDDQRPVVLICRSGRRSVDAGEALERVGMTRVINVLEGFEGDLDDNQHRGTLGGWRFAGLPWEQF